MSGVVFGRACLNHMINSSGRDPSGSLHEPCHTVSKGDRFIDKEVYSQAERMKDFHKSSNLQLTSPIPALQEHQLGRGQPDEHAGRAVGPTTMIAGGSGVVARWDGV